MTRDPNRRVRFALDVEDHSSPASTYSALSSPGPHTPPQLSYQPLVHIHQPHSTPSPSVAFHDLSLAIPQNIHGALELLTFDFDVSLNPFANPAIRKNPQLSSIWDEPATNPLVRSLTLTSRHLRWDIVIHSSSKPYVTIGDVVGGIFNELRTPVTPEEFNMETESSQKGISWAYYNRFERHASDPEFMKLEKSKGVKRVDFLTGANRLTGLVKTDKPNVWYMKLKR